MSLLAAALLPVLVQTTDMFTATWFDGGDASMDCDFESPGGDLGGEFDCNIEGPEQSLVERWINPDATVLEFGARFGHTTCAIATKLQNSGALISVEPDEFVWNSIEANVKAHNCNAHLVQGVISNKGVIMVEGEYGSRAIHVDAHDNLTQVKEQIAQTIADPYKRQNFNADLQKHIQPHYNLEHVQRTLGLQVDTLLIDCEGCAPTVLDLFPDLNQIQLILLEADMPAGERTDCAFACVNYTQLIARIEAAGLALVDEFNDCDFQRSSDKCFDWINHYAFKRK